MLEWDWQSVADCTVALGTIFAIGVAVLQLRANNKLASENFARQLWMDYLKIGFDHPQFSTTQIAIEHFRLPDVQALTSGDSLASQQYFWYLTMVLDTSENIAIHLPLKLWEKTVFAQLHSHKEALSELWESGKCPWKQFYTPTLDGMVQKVLSGNKTFVEYEDQETPRIGAQDGKSISGLGSSASGATA